MWVQRGTPLLLCDEILWREGDKVEMRQGIGGER